VNGMDIEDIRVAMLNMYKSNITSYLGYLISVVIGFTSLLKVKDFLNLLYLYRFLPLFMFISIFIGFVINFFGRAIYYACLSEAILFVDPYNEKNLKNYKNDKFKLITEEEIKFNFFLSFNETCHDFLRRINFYKDYAKKRKYKFAVFFEDSIKSLISTLCISIVIGFFIWLFYYIFIIN